VEIYSTTPIKRASITEILREIGYKNGFKNQKTPQKLKRFLIIYYENKVYFPTLLKSRLLTLFSNFPTLLPIY
jgi:hypothetical protein